MKYLFFDIECANCLKGQGKICSFGYCITDEKFNVMEQQDILINPKSRFHLGPYSGDPAIHLGYEQEEFLKHPDFSNYYLSIRELLQKDDQIVFGHSVGNDLSFILSECKRYGKDDFYVKAYDSQSIYKQIKNEKNDAGLEKICEMYQIEMSHLHRSDYDAWLTMNVVKKLCEENATDIQGLLELCPNSFVELKNGGVLKSFNTVSNSKKLLLLSKKFHISKSKAIPAQKGIYYCFDAAFEEDSFVETRAYVALLKVHGAEYAMKPRKCTYFVKGKGESDKYKIALSAIESGHQVKIINIDEFKEMLHITEDEVKTFIERGVQ